MPTLVICAMILFTAIFLPWASFNGIAGTTGTSNWGAMSCVAAILGLGLAFLANAKARALGLMVVGVLALVGAIIYAVRLEGSIIDFGLIFEMLFAIVAVIIGFMNYTNRGFK